MQRYSAKDSDDNPLAAAIRDAYGGTPDEVPGGHHDSPLAADILTEALAWVLDSNEGS